MRARPTFRSFSIISLAATLVMLTGCSSNNAPWTAAYSCTKTWSIGPEAITWQDMLNGTLPAEQAHGHEYNFQLEAALQDWNSKLRQANHYAGPLAGSLPAGSTISMPTLCPATATKP